MDLDSEETNKRGGSPSDHASKRLRSSTGEDINNNGGGAGGVIEIPEIWAAIMECKFVCNSIVGCCILECVL